MIQVQGLRKHYITGSSHVSVLRGVDLNIQAGEAVCLLGSSGAGKSTLLQILGTLDRPTEGEVLFEGSSLFEKTDDQLALFRNETMGFVFQFHHLIHELSALENVMLPGLLAKLPKEETKQKALEWLEFMGLAERAHHYPNQLSGGELQRVAIARALIRNPRILLADEPTGNLDSANAQTVYELMLSLQRQTGMAMVIVTHDMQLAASMSRVLQMRDGQFV